jgi:heat shock protein HslJ
MKLFLLITMVFASVTHFLGGPPRVRPAGVVIKSAMSEMQDTVSLAGEWFLVPVLASDTAAGKLPSIRFNLALRKFSGFTGCNQMSGSFTLQADQLHLDQNISFTKTVCPGYNEKEFITNLLRVDHYKIKEGVLWLTTDQTPIAKWMRKPDSKSVL